MEKTRLMPVLPIATLRPKLPVKDWTALRPIVSRYGRLREFDAPMEPEAKYLWKWVCLNISPMWEHHEFPDPLYGSKIDLDRQKRLDEVVCEVVSLIPRAQRHGQLKHGSLRILTEGVYYGKRV